MGISQQTPFLLWEGGKAKAHCSAKKRFFAFSHPNSVNFTAGGVLLIHKTLYCSFVSPHSVGGVCLLQSVPDSQLPPCTLPRSQNAGLTGKVADPDCHRVQSHHKKNPNFQQRMCEFLSCLNFSFHTQHFGINEAHLRLMFLHPIVSCLQSWDGSGRSMRKISACF